LTVSLSELEKNKMGAMKAIYTDVCDAMYTASHNLLEAVESGDADLMEAVLVNTLAGLPSYLEALRSTK
jgi:hypothetical protein